MFYVYKVRWYDSYSDEEKEEDGLVFANNYGKAANKVVEDYGPENVINIFLSMICTDEGIHCISRQEITYSLNE